MNFYTSTYDLNNPTTTQVNVPTNTSYRVGLKFKRNGEIQNLQTTEVMFGTLSADAEKTNGYITYTTESGDEPSFQQFNVVVDTRVPSDQETQSSATKTASNANETNSTYVTESVLSAFVGKKIYADTVKMQVSYDEVNWTDIEEMWGVVPFQLRTNLTPLAGCGSKTILGDHRWHKIVNGAYDLTESFDYMEVPEVKPRMILVSGGLSKALPTVSTFPVKFRLTFKVGDPATGYTQTVKLNVNVVKSQKGDLNPTPTEFETVNFAGTDGQGNPFSYDIVVK